MNIVQWLAHSIEEYDQLRLLTSLGHTVFSPGAYIQPNLPSDGKRPSLPNVKAVAELKDVVDHLGQPNHPPHGECNGVDAHADTLEASKLNVPDEVIEWADVFIIHHKEHTWLGSPRNQFTPHPQWDRIKNRARVIWRTVGQSSHFNEFLMQPLRDEGLQIVRYSPRERNIPEFAGEDVLIRFYKDPTEWQGWTGEGEHILNVTQGLYQRSLDDSGNLQPRGR